MYSKIAEFVMDKLFKMELMPKGERKKFLQQIAESLEGRLGAPIYPNSSDSLAVSLQKPKTAALAFDKVYRSPIIADPVPEEFGFYCATAPEVYIWTVGLLKIATENPELKDVVKSEAKIKRTTEKQKEKIAEAGLRLLCSELQKTFQVAPTIFYQAPRNLIKAFPNGSQEVLTAALINIAMVEEEQLSWDQIKEFRKDSKARTKYRRLVRWVDDELKKKKRSPAEIEDLIATRLDDYEWAMKKHGLKASVGALSCLLDPKFLGATSATIAAGAMAGGGVWAALAGSTLAVGRAAVSFGTTFIDGLDQRRKTNYEVAYVHDIKKRLGK